MQRARAECCRGAKQVSDMLGKTVFITQCCAGTCGAASWQSSMGMQGALQAGLQALWSLRMAALIDSAGVGGSSRG